MDNTLLFFIHPGQFFRKVIDGKSRLYLLLTLSVYCALYILSEIQTGYLSRTAYRPLFYIDNELLAILTSLFLEFAVSISLAMTIYLLLRVSRSHANFISVLLCVLSLKIISILVIPLSLLSLVFLKNNIYAHVWQLLEFVLQMMYLFTAIKYGFGTSISKTVVVQLGSVLIIATATLVVLSLRNYQSTTSLVNKALKDMQSFQFDKATERLETAVKNEPSNALYQYYLGECRRQYVFFARYKGLNPDVEKTLLGKAEKAYKKSISLDQSSLNARMGLGLLYTFMKRYEEALEQFEVIIERDPKNLEAYRKMGEVYLKLNKPKLAKKYLKVAVSEKIETLPLKREFQLENVKKIKLLDARYIDIQSRIIWHIIDPILYEGTVGSIEEAEKRINDVYAANLMTIMGAKTYERVSKGLAREIEKEIIDELNNSILKKRYGIEIVDLVIKFM